MLCVLGGGKCHLMISYVRCCIGQQFRATFFYFKESNLFGFLCVVGASMYEQKLRRYIAKTESGGSLEELK